MDGISTSIKVSRQKKATVAEQRVLINDLRKMYPFAVRDVIETEHNLNVLYNNKEIAMLLQKVVTERDASIARKNEKQRRTGRSDEEENVEEEAAAVEESDEFEMQDTKGIVEDYVKEGAATVQDLLFVIKKAELEEALPQAITLLKLAATIPLTSVHCERVFSRMKRVISPSRSSMNQCRKEHLVMLQVEHKLLRSLATKCWFENIVIYRLKSYNRRRF